MNEKLNDWSSFISDVGIPMAILFIILMVFVLPFVLLLLSLIKKYVPKLISSHIDFMDTSMKTQETNAKTLAKLEEAVSVKHEDHLATHRAILLGTKAGLAILDGQPHEARGHLEKIEETLAKPR